MKFEDLQSEWEQDSKIDRTELGEESLRIPQLHSKYFKLFSAERIRLKQLENEYKTFYRLRYEYYMGILDHETLKHYEWEPNPMKILKSDMSIYMESDHVLQTLQQRIDFQKEKVELLESIIKHLPNRGFNIKAAIDWTKFQHGT